MGDVFDKYERVKVVALKLPYTFDKSLLSDFTPNSGS